MIYSTPRKVYFCVNCGLECQTLHEIFPGSARRKICIDFSLQVPVCNTCHQKAHGTYSTNEEKRPQDYKEQFIDYLGLDYYMTIKAINNKKLRSYLEVNKDKCEERIRELEVW